MMTMTDLRVDHERKFYSGTEIYVRAIGFDGKWDSVDLAQLDRASVISWLKSRGGDNPWAENTVLILLGHEPLQHTGPAPDTKST